MTLSIVVMAVCVAVLVYVIYRATARVRRYRAGRVSPAAMRGGALHDVGWIIWSAILMLTTNHLWSQPSVSSPPLDYGLAAAMLVSGIIMLCGAALIPEAERPRLWPRRAPSRQLGDAQ